MGIAKITDIDGGGNFPSGGFDFAGGEKTFAFQGSFNNADIKIQASFANGAVSSWTNLTDSEGSIINLTQPGIINIDIGQCKLRFNVTENSGGTPDVEVRIS